MACKLDDIIINNFLFMNMHISNNFKKLMLLAILFKGGEDKTTLFENTLPYLWERFCIEQHNISPLYIGESMLKNSVPLRSPSLPLLGEGFCIG